MKIPATNLAAAAALAMLLAAPAWSQERGFYLGGSVGRAEAKDVCENTTDLGVNISCDDNDVGFRLFAGYQVNRHFAVELGYADLGEATSGVVTSGGISANASVSAVAWDLVAVGSFPLMERFAIFGKLGIYRAESELSGGGTVRTASAPINASPVSFRGEETNSGLTFGAGIGYDFTRNFGVRAEWQRYQEVGGGDIGEADVDVLSAGILYRF
jgi:OOP family OmpA-OmpF porin